MVEANREAASLRLRIHNCCGTPAALPAPKSVWGSEAATPGLPVARCAFLEVFPLGNSLSLAAGCHWLCRNHPAKSGTITFRCNHCYSVWFDRQQKIPARLCRTCGRCHFPVEGGGKVEPNLRHQITCPNRLSYLDGVKASPTRCAIPAPANGS